MGQNVLIDVMCVSWHVVGLWVKVGVVVGCGFYVCRVFACFFICSVNVVYV